jgi:hypothetical protein
LRWLGRFKCDPIAMMNLRCLASEHIPFPHTLWRCPNDEVLKELAYRLLDGSLQVFATRQPMTPASSFARSAGPAPALGKPLPTPRAKRSSSAAVALAATVPAEPDTLPKPVDGALTAAALCMAAQNGKPFCAECVRAAVAREALKATGNP